MSEKSTALEWAKSGENDWVTTAPSGAAAAYEGPRFAFVEPPVDASFNQRFSLSVDLKFSHRLTLTAPGIATGALSRETAFDRLAKRARYALEPQARHDAFDRRVYAALDDAQSGHTLVALPESRRLILELFDLGVKRIVADREGLGVKIGYALSPAMDGGQALSAIVTRLDALAGLWPREETASSGYPVQIGGPGMAWAVGRLWPHAEAIGRRLPWRIDRRTIALAWAGGWLAATLGAASLMTEHDARQIEGFAHPDWSGMAALLAIIVLPAAALVARRADAHKVLGMVFLGAVLALPFSATLRVVEVNRLAARAEQLAPAEIVDLIEYDAQSAALVVVDDRPMQWRLSPEQAALARERRLCATATTVEGLRGLRYVSGLRVWACRQMDDVRGLTPS